MDETTAQADPKPLTRGEKIAAGQKKRRERLHASELSLLTRLKMAMAEVVSKEVGEIKGSVDALAKRVEAVETVGSPSITVQTKDGRVLSTPGVGAKQTLPAREVKYPTPTLPEGTTAHWIECPNGHVAAWSTGEHPSTPEVIDLISGPNWHRLRPGQDDRRAAIRGVIPPCNFCGAALPANAAGVGSSVFNVNARYVREGPPPNTDEHGFPVR
jgi:hypothetical protein